MTFDLGRRRCPKKKIFQLHWVHSQCGVSQVSYKCISGLVYTHSWFEWLKLTNRTDISFETRISLQQHHLFDQSHAQRWKYILLDIMNTPKHICIGEFYSLRHLNDPTVFSHKSFSMQLCVPLVHSSTSENGDKSQRLLLDKSASGHLKLNRAKK